MSEANFQPLQDYQSAQQLAAISPVSLADVNWSVRLVQSSSKSDNLNEPRVVLQLRLLDKTGEGDQNKWTTVEMNESDLDGFIAKLEQTSQIMHTLSK